MLKEIFKKAQSGILIVSLLVSCIFVFKLNIIRAEATGTDYSWGPLAGTDDLGRTLCNYSTAGQLRSDRFVGMFYFTWHGAYEHREYRRVYNIDRIVADNLNAPYEYSNPVWPNYAINAYWDEPMFGYYRSDDPWVVRKQIQMLADAGVDFLILDATNDLLYKQEADLVMRTIEDLQRQGKKAPQVAFVTKTDMTARMDEIYNTFYCDTAPYRHPSTWFYWKGKPLLWGDAASASQTVANYFTLRDSQWPNEAQRPNGWDWMSWDRPQRINYNNLGEKEQISVALAHHGNGFMSHSAWYGVTNWSRSWHNGVNDNTPGAVNYGYNAQEQWDFAIQEDPLVIFVTGWNEWFAGNWQQTDNDPLLFVDAATQNYSRDIEPMKGGHIDNYYMQLVDNIRRYKGVEVPRTPSAAKTIAINTDFTQWSDVTPTFKDYVWDTASRKHGGREDIEYVNDTGRNDLDIMKVARDANNIYFYVKTIGNITSYTDPKWMRLFLNTDGNGTNGWKGYDYVINRTGVGANATTLERSTGGWNWQTVSSAIIYKVVGSELHLAIPRSNLSNLTDPFNIEFKWSDNMQTDGDPMDFYINGDTAPEGRFNYVFNTGTLPTPVPAPSVPSPGASHMPPADGHYKIEDNDRRTEYGHASANWTSVSDSTCSGGSLTYSNSSDTIRMGFYGSGVKWITSKRSDGGIVEIFIDGYSHGKVSLYSPQTQNQVVVFEKFGLEPDRYHHFLVKHVSGTIYHDAVEYRTGDTSIPTPTPGENMALKALASASSFTVGFATSAGNANDGDASTYWYAEGLNNQWLILDFGRNMIFNKVQFLQNTANSRINGYKIQYLSGTTWVDAYTGGVMEDNDTDMFAAVTAQKVRLLVTSTTQYQPSIFEMKVFYDPNPVLFSFDFGTSASPIETGYIGINRVTAYSTASGYGWVDTSTMLDVDRFGPDNIKRDLCFDYGPEIFRTDLPNGTYSVTVRMGDKDYAHDQMNIKANGIMVASAINTAVNQWIDSTFNVTVANGRLDLEISDSGGSDYYWVINAIDITQILNVRKYDFGTYASPVETGYSAVNRATEYTTVQGYGWTNTSTMLDVDRLGPDNLRRDLCFDHDARVFRADLANGTYNVLVRMGDKDYAHDYMAVKLNGSIIATGINTAVGEWRDTASSVTVNGGVLEVEFIDNGGDYYWVVNSIEIIGQ